jgi:hypothetical protein
MMIGMAAINRYPPGPDLTRWITGIPDKKSILFISRAQQDDRI